MNFLSLCQRLRSEARIPGTGPSSVTGQTGELAKIVEWITTAYAVVGQVLVNPTGTGDFTGATTDLDATNVTTTYQDLMALPPQPRTS